MRTYLNLSITIILFGNVFFIACSNQSAGKPNKNLTSETDSGTGGESDDAKNTMEDSDSDGDSDSDSDGDSDSDSDGDSDSDSDGDSDDEEGGGDGDVDGQPDSTADVNIETNQESDTNSDTHEDRNSDRNIETGSAMDTNSDVENSTSTGDDTGGALETESDIWLDIEPIELSDVAFVLNPYQVAPLSAIVKVTHEDLIPEDVTRIRVIVIGKGDGDPNLTADLESQSEAYKANFDMSDQLKAGEVGIPVLGLYPSSENRVIFRLGDANHAFEGEVIIPVELALLEEQESVTLSVVDTNRMEPGLTYLNGRVYDHFGNLRWSGPDIYRILKNGNILSDLDEINWLGKTLLRRTLPGNLTSHYHDSIELPDGNIIACVTNSESSILNINGSTVNSIEDYIVELDTESNIQNVWDLREYLDVTRGTVSVRQNDWVHVNTVTYDEEDDTILVSGRYQGILKLTRGGLQGEEPNAAKELVWIMAPHMGWELSGWNGEGPLDPNLYLLAAVDSNGNPYDENVQANLAAPDRSLDPFYWLVGQHGLHITSRDPGKISFLAFNNQASFIFDGEDTINNGVTADAQGDLSNDRSSVPYSQIVEYEIDEESMTVRQLWSFGEDNPDLYGSRNGGVNVLKTTGNRMMISNGGDQHDSSGEGLNPHVVEVSKQGEVVFHLEIDGTDMSAYRGGRIDLYHPGQSQ